MFALNKAVTSIPTQQVYFMPWGKKTKKHRKFGKITLGKSVYKCILYTSLICVVINTLLSVSLTVLSPILVGKMVIKSKISLNIPDEGRLPYSLSIETEFPQLGLSLKIFRFGRTVYSIGHVPAEF